MTPFLIITGKTAIALAVFYLFFHFVLSKDKLFFRNRLYLLSVSILSFVLPWIVIPVIETETQFFSFAYVVNDNQVGQQVVITGVSEFPWGQLLLYLYFVGIVTLLVKTLLSYFQVFQIIRKALPISSDKLKIVASTQDLPPFSFFMWIVIPSHINHNHPSYEKMVQHEMVHCRQFHSVDLLIGELLLSLQWFNPFAWFLRKSISENLEFLVDEEMLKAGTNVKDYQYSLLSFSMVGLKPAVANNFNTNLLKKRIVMMNKRKYPKNQLVHNILIPVCCMVVIIFTASFEKQVKASELVNSPVENVDTKSEAVKNYEVEVSNGEDVFLKFLMQNIKYPKSAAEKLVFGKVKAVVTFSSQGAEVSFTKTDGLKEMKEVVVVGYPPKGVIVRRVEDISPGIEDLQNEVDRVVKTFKIVPTDLIGKTFILPVKFKLEGVDAEVIGYGNSTGKSGLDENVVIIEAAGQNVNGERDEPYFILDNEKIISKSEMEGIDPNTIKSVSVIKAKKIEHKKLGKIDGSIVIIKTK